MHNRVWHPLNRPWLFTLYFGALFLAGAAFRQWTTQSASRYENAMTLKNSEQLWVACVLVGGVVLISLVATFAWGIYVINGRPHMHLFQGRYFLPLLPLALLLASQWLRPFSADLYRARGVLIAVLIAATLYMNYLYFIRF